MVTTAADRPVAVERARFRVVPVVGTVVGVAVVVTTLLVAQSGLHGNARISNPDGAFSRETLLGVNNWPVVSTWIFVGIITVLCALLVRATKRAGRLPEAAILFLAYPSVALTDPAANWVTFAAFDPRTPHFPMSWKWINNAPLVEPIMALLGGYPMYYLTVALGAYVLHKKALARARPGSFLERHPTATLFAFALIVGIPLDTGAQLLWMRAHLYVYTEGVGPNVVWQGVTFPWLWAIYDAWMFACTAVLLRRDDRGRSIYLTKASALLPIGRRTGEPSSARQTGVAALILFVAVLVPIIGYGAARVAGVTHAAYDDYPFPEAKVYDPYGHLAEAGKPGPFYE